ncbi:MAG TPA: hypothetical protein VHS56_01090 [Candidatus Cybelea sp.]|nr:hypothetical protein [Candidatus Cybelea sp.]
MSGGRVLAQSAAASPAPDPHVYTDAAMNFTAPTNAVLVGRVITFSLDSLTTDLQPVATWVIRPGEEDARTIQLQMESYTGSPSQWEAQFESQTHGGDSSSLIRNKTPMTLLNGMPATFVEVAYGSGFDARKEYAVVWADGQRGVVLQETTRMGDTTSEQAKETLKQVTAVAYPTYQP